MDERGREKASEMEQERGRKVERELKEEHKKRDRHIKEKD